MSKEELDMQNLKKLLSSFSFMCFCVVHFSIRALLIMVFWNWSIPAIFDFLLPAEDEEINLKITYVQSVCMYLLFRAFSDRYNWKSKAKR